MTLEEAIKHARDTAENRTDLCEECRAEHEQLAEWLEELVRLREENERLKSVEFTCGFIKPHKVLECPIFDEIVKAKADTVREMQERFSSLLEEEYRTYTPEGASDFFKNGSYMMWTIAERVLSQIAKEILEDNDG